MKKAPLSVIDRRTWKFIPSSFDHIAGFGTLLSQVAGFHRAVPSATLDKDSVVSPYKHIYYTCFSAKVNGFFGLFQNILSILFHRVYSLTIDFFAPFLYHTDIRSKGVFYIMKELRRRFDRFCLKNRNKGIPNLMMVIGIGNVITYILSVIDPSHVVYSLLCFSPTKVLHGQVWRLFSYIFTYLLDASSWGVLLAAVSLYCCYQFGKILENYWGTLRFNLYYLVGLLMTDLAALLMGYPATASALNLSLFLAVATIAPDLRVYLMFILPLKLKYLAWVYLGVTAWNVVQMLLSYSLLRFYWLMPLVPLANYFLFFGKSCMNVLPGGNRVGARKFQFKRKSGGNSGNPNWASKYRSASGRRPGSGNHGEFKKVVDAPAYRHKCTVCGRTDVSNPELEFRYCSKCNGFYCYCQDHINNHVHIQ